MITHNQFL